MDQIQYVGEHLLPGQIGRFSIFLAFSAAIVAFVFYLIATIRENKGLEDESWRKLARAAYIVHGVAVLGIVGALYSIISNHYFEYHYAWQHSSKDMPTKYLLACFWEGQEGSFLLWTFWHVVLGLIIMFTVKRKWESPMLVVFAITQIFLTSMLVGFYIGSYKLGSNPFLLMRDTITAPIFSRPDYLNFLTDGNGLNPLLQNYWMVIHPPTLFLGFATTIIPFAFVIASLWRRDYLGWVKPALPWTLFSTMLLGIGILMGGAWAYESLTFGGFWAWDPVENASLVPWLTLVAGLHVLVAFRSSQHGLVATYVLFIATFLLILYSTFLTRSGILGNTSVHSFTDLGMSGQLLVFMLFYVVAGGIFLTLRWKEIPTPEKEEQFSSREFWVFVGTLVFVISAIQITIYMSVPIYNKIFGFLKGYSIFKAILPTKEIAPPKDPIAKYNSFQVFIAIFLGLFTGFVQYLRYKSSDWMKVAKTIGASVLTSVIFAGISAYYLKFDNWTYSLMLFASFFAIFANFGYILRVLKGNILVSGGSVAHIGFGLMLVGVLISNAKQQVISINEQGTDFGTSFDEKAKHDNLLLKLDEETKMGNYQVTFTGDTTVAPNTYYHVNYVQFGKTRKDTIDKFTLAPNAQLNPKMGIVASPDTRHYLDRDIYTHVTSVPDRKAIEAEIDSFVPQTAGTNDTFYVAKGFAIVGKPNTKPSIPDSLYRPGDIGVGVDVVIQTLAGKSYNIQPAFIIRDKAIIYVSSEVKDLGVKMRLENIDPTKGKFTIGVSQSTTENNFIIMKAIIFPYINALWLGVLIMVSGFVISIVRRRNERLRDEAKGI